MAESTGTTAPNGGGGTAIELDPYSCLPKRNQKYASECVELFLSERGANKIGKAFEHFANVEVVWFNGNRLSRIDNLEDNFRIKEVYIQDNMLVSLAGLRTFKFLKVLLASNNQIRNLEKQLALLKRFAFLQKLDLFGNPVAEEPDYRLRLIYNIPQVETLDRSSVKGPERLKADEVVPNLDKVSAAKAAAGPRKKGWGTFSQTEKDCFRGSAEIKTRRAREEQARLQRSLLGGANANAAYSDTKIWVSGVPEGTTEAQLCESFEVFGPVAVEKLPGRYKPSKAVTMHSTGDTAVVRFEKVASAREALTGTEEMLLNDAPAPTLGIHPYPFPLPLAPHPLPLTMEKFKNSTAHERVALTDWEKGWKESNKGDYAGQFIGGSGLADFVATAMPGSDALDQEGLKKLVQLCTKEAGGVIGKVLCDPKALPEHHSIHHAPALNRGSVVGLTTGGQSPRDSTTMSRLARMNAGGRRPGQEGEEEDVVDFWDRWKTNPEAKVSMKEALDWLGGLEWRFEEDELVDEHLQTLYEEAHKLATTVDEVDANRAEVVKLSRRISILEGVKTKKHEASVAKTERALKKEAVRGDLLHQRILTQSLQEDDEGHTLKVTGMSERSKIWGGDQKHGH